MGIDVTVRSCTERDIPAIFEFIRKKATFDASMKACNGEIQTSEEAIKETLFGPQPYAQVLFAETHGNPVGFALYYFRYSSFKGRPHLWLDDLYVNDGSRSQGAGAALMRSLAQIALAAQCTHIGWTARVDNVRGVKFYERLGAKIIEQKDDRFCLQVDEQAIQGLVQGNKN